MSLLHQCQQRPTGELRLLLYRSYNEPPVSPIGECQRRPDRKLGFSFPLGSNNLLLPVSVGIMWRTGFLLPPAGKSSPPFSRWAGLEGAYWEPEFLPPPRSNEVFMVSARAMRGVSTRHCCLHWAGSYLPRSRGDPEHLPCQHSSNEELLTLTAVRVRNLDFILLSFHVRTQSEKARLNIMLE